MPDQPRRPLPPEYAAALLEIAEQYGTRKGGLTPIGQVLHERVLERARKWAKKHQQSTPER